MAHESWEQLLARKKAERAQRFRREKNLFFWASHAGRSAFIGLVLEARDVGDTLWLRVGTIDCVYPPPRKRWFWEKQSTFPVVGDFRVTGEWITNDEFGKKFGDPWLSDRNDSFGKSCDDVMCLDGMLKFILTCRTNIPSDPPTI